MGAIADRLREKASLLEAVRLDKNYPLLGASMHWDDTVMALCKLLMTADRDARDAFFLALGDRQRAALGRYAYRSPMLALWERSEQRLRTGLVAAAFSQPEQFDHRDTMIGLALHHHSARELGLDPAAVFGEAAALAPAHTADLLRTFGRRNDVTLSIFGWEEVPTRDGPAFRPLRDEP